MIYKKVPLLPDMNFFKNINFLKFSFTLKFQKTHISKKLSPSKGEPSYISSPTKIFLTRFLTHKKNWQKFSNSEKSKFLKTQKKFLNSHLGKCGGRPFVKTIVKRWGWKTYWRLYSFPRNILKVFQFLNFCNIFLT
jgi:hypothetical protein